MADIGHMLSQITLIIPQPSKKISSKTNPSHPHSIMSITTMLLHNHRQLNHLSQLTTEHNSHSHILHWHYTDFDDHNFQIHGQTLFYLFILFSIILLVTLILLYGRWYFRFRHLHHPHLHHAPPNAEARGDVPCRGMDSAAIKAMPIILHQESPVERMDEMECCICLGVFEDGDKVKILPDCRHRFHSDCVDRWLLAQSSCPLCRMSVRVDPPSHSALYAV